MVPRYQQVDPPGQLLDAAPLLVLHELPPDALELAPLAPAPLWQLQGRQGLLDGAVADKVVGGGGAAEWQFN